MTISSHLPSAPTSATWQPQDQEAIRQALGLPATVPCLDAIGRAMADLERGHPAGVLSARALLDAVVLIDQQLLVGGPEQEQAIEKLFSSGPIAGSVAAGGDAPLQKADVIAYDTALLRMRRASTQRREDRADRTDSGLRARRGADHRAVDDDGRPAAAG